LDHALRVLAKDLSAYLRKYGIALDLEALASRAASLDAREALTMAVKHHDFASRTYEAARAARRQVMAIYAHAFEAHRVAALAFPTTPLPAMPIGHDSASLARNTEPGSVAGMPGISLPIGRTPTGLPVGLALDAVPGKDRDLLAIGLSIEKLFGFLSAPAIAVPRLADRVE
jgi:indoleacetamide hydrolase